MANIIPIKDLAAEGLLPYAHLNENQLLHYYEPNGGLFIGESPNVILRAMAAGYEPVSALIETKYLDTEAAPILAECGDIPVYTAELPVLSGITGYHLTRGILCAFRRKKMPSPEEILQGAHRIAVLWNVENPTNVGAIFRNAAALYLDAVLLTEDSSDPLFRRSARVSVGTVFQIPWTYFDKEKGPALLRFLGFKTAAMALRQDTVSITDPALQKEEKLAVILGNEGEGLPPEVLSQCDYTIKIPMSHGVDSLNVAAASAVAFWELSGKNHVRN